MGACLWTHLELEEVRWKKLHLNSVHARFVTEEDIWKDAVAKAEEGRAGEAVEALGGCGARIWWAVQVCMWFGWVQGWWVSTIHMKEACNGGNM